MTDVFSPFSRVSPYNNHHHQQYNGPLPSVSLVPDDVDDNQDSSPKQSKNDAKPQATFLTKLYALLERQEYQQMIRWDPLGEQIIVERPEQLALHVLPSIYRQSRFASFSRQLNIYGFMRKVNLRNVDPAIDDPDASTWSHPTLNRNSSPEVVANFKRRVPPRLPKPRKRSEPESTSPHSAHLNMMKQNQQPPQIVSSMNGNRPRTVSSAGGGSHGHLGQQQPSNQHPMGPSSFFPQSLQTPSLPTQHGNSKWNHPYGRTALPPLTIPSSEPSYPHNYPNSHNNNHHHGLHPLTPTDDMHPGSYAPHVSVYTPQNVHQGHNPTIREHNVFSHSAYSPSSDSPVGPSPINGPPGSSSWSYLPPPHSSGNASAGGASSLSSLLNPTNLSAYSSTAHRGSNNGSFPSPFTAVPTHHASSLSPDSRPTTGYSISSSVASSTLPYDLIPSPATTSSFDNNTRPSSSKSGSGGSGSLSVRRPRRVSEASSHPYSYPSYYDGAASGGDGRPLTAPSEYAEGRFYPSSQQRQGNNRPNHSNSMITAPADFAYSVSGSSPQGQGGPQGPASWRPSSSGGMDVRRPSTATSSGSGIDGFELDMDLDGMGGRHDEDVEGGLAQFLHNSRPTSASSS